MGLGLFPVLALNIWPLISQAPSKLITKQGQCLIIVGKIFFVHKLDKARLLLHAADWMVPYIERWAQIEKKRVGIPFDATNYNTML